ncbi:MAG TPA: hypothetical protein VK668_01700 [Mucilaginibacter sp.]|nr:hypothetical protein [Mucilaginibacter sp.]
MKRTFLLFVTLIFVISSCKKDDPAINAKKDNGDGPVLGYNDSYSAWVSYKNNVGNNYAYTVAWGSFFGFGAELKTNVSNGKVVSRDYTAYTYAQNSSVKTVSKQWHEDGAALNTHPNDAAEALTIDGVYLKAKNVWLKADPKTNDIYFETKNNGIISSCGYVPKGCQDDCFNGIHITAVTAL